MKNSCLNCKYCLLAVPAGSEEIMSTGFSNVGFDVNSEQDVYDLIKNCSEDKRVFYEKDNLSFAIVRPDRNSELWYYGDADGVDGRYCELYYKSPHVLEGENLGWVVKPDSKNCTGILQIMCDGGEIEFPLNITLPDAFLYSEDVLAKRVRVRMTWFAQDIEFFDDEDDYSETCSSKLAPEACIPCGTFAIPGHEETFEPSSTAIMSGKVLFAEKRTNGYSNNEYWFITVTCCGHIFDMVADPECVGEIVAPGNIVYGTFWISGKLTEDEVTDESEGRSLELTMTRPVSEWCMAQIKRILLHLRPIAYEHLIVEFENLLDDRVEFIQTYKCKDDDFFDVEIGFNRKDTGEKLLLIGSKIHNDEMLDVFTQVCLDGTDPRKIAAAEKFEMIDYLNERDGDDEEPGDDISCKTMQFEEFKEEVVNRLRKSLSGFPNEEVEKYIVDSEKDIRSFYNDAVKDGGHPNRFKGEIANCCWELELCF